MVGRALKLLIAELAEKSAKVAEKAFFLIDGIAI